MMSTKDKDSPPLEPMEPKFGFTYVNGIGITKHKKATSSSTDSFCV
jgi:hypothetical protein